MMKKDVISHAWFAVEKYLHCLAISAHQARQSGFSRAGFLFPLGIKMVGQITINMISASVLAKISRHKPNIKRPPLGHSKEKSLSEQNS